MGGIHIFEKPHYREIRVMRGRAMRGLPVFEKRTESIHHLVSEFSLRYLLIFKYQVFTRLRNIG